MGIRLIPSAEAELAVGPMGGTRHTSARRFSYDQSEAVVVVVSDDGPVTVFRGGEVIGRSVARLTDRLAAAAERGEGPLASPPPDSPTSI